MSDEERSSIQSALHVESSLQYPQAKREQLSGTLVRKYENTSVSREYRRRERGQDVERRNIATEEVREVNCTRRVMSELTSLRIPHLSLVARTDDRSRGWAGRSSELLSPDPVITSCACVTRSVHVRFAWSLAQTTIALLSELLSVGGSACVGALRRSGCVYIRSSAHHRSID
jgi:hypothetical protein